MKKIALVNLSSYEDISKWPSYNQDVDFLNKNNIPFVDYASNCSSREDLLKKFEDAIKDEDVLCIWFVCGGNKLIEFIDLFDWESIKESKKIFIGLSDFTHFLLLASSYDITSYYGLALKKISKYYSIESRSIISNFLLSILEEKNEKSDYVYKDDEIIIGGHLMISIFMINNFDISLEGKRLFIEHHNVPGETIDDLLYYINQLCLILQKNKPLSVILGHSMLFDAEGKDIDYRLINSKITELINEKISIPISEVDHFTKVIKFN